jgi:hypothetical protein
MAQRRKARAAGKIAVFCSQKNVNKTPRIADFIHKLFNWLAGSRLGGPLGGIFIEQHPRPV